MKIPKSVKKLTEAFERLPGIGPKTAQRLTFYLLHVPQEELDMLSSSVTGLKEGTKICSICRNIGEDDPCEICTDDGRDTSIIAVVESPLDVLALEKSGFNGLYHVLHGVISPLNNVGPDDLFIADLMKRLKGRSKNAKGRIIDGVAINTTDVFGSELLAPLGGEGGMSGVVSEVIMATNTNMEGESTALYISRLITDAKNEVGEIKITRIARGLPTGGDIQYADDVTLKRAIEGRVSI